MTVVESAVKYTDMEIDPSGENSNADGKKDQDVVCAYFRNP